MTRPISDEQLNAFDDEARDYSVVTMTDDEWGALRERLRLAESYGKGFENQRLDLVNERNELGRRLALADAVVADAARVLQRSTYVTLYFPEFAASVAAYRAAKETT
jgi:hypothetical protein